MAIRRAKSAPRDRDLPLDAFRGLDVLVMILVNVQGSAVAAWPFIKHAEWNGLTLADVVFPLFLLILGLSAPLALDRPRERWSWSKVLRRTALLFAIGMALTMAIHPTLDPALIRWSGVLQRIAVAYFACAVTIRLSRGIGLPLALALLFLVGQSLLILFVGTPEGGPPSLDQGMGISGWLDQHFIPGKVLGRTYEPEGILSTFSAVANALIGLAVMRWHRDGGLTDGALSGLAATLLVAGLALTPWLPLNKNLWTASFTLVTSGIGLGCWAALRTVWPRIGGSRLAIWIVGLGQAALTLYVVHHVLLAVIVRTLPSGERIWEVTYRWLLATGLSPAIASMVYAVIAAAISCAMLPLLRRQRWLLKV